MNALKPLFAETLRELLAPVYAYLENDSVSEIMINGPTEIYIESGGRIRKVPETFESDEALRAAARNIAQYSGKRLTMEESSIEARLPDGSRVHVVQPPAARKGLCIAIRKFSKHQLGLADLVSRGAMTAECADFLSVAVRAKKNILVSGGTGSGKTTLLNCLSAMIPENERIIVIEDSSELQLQQEHVVPLEAQPADRFGKGGISIRELFRASLRMRPDRIVVGECRGGEALDMVQAMSSGHGGSMSTLHADGAAEALSRLETLALMGGVELPLMALRAQISNAVDLVVQVNRAASGWRGVVEVAEILGMDPDHRYVVSPLLLPEEGSGPSSEVRLTWTGRRPSFAEAARRQFTLDGPSRGMWEAQRAAGTGSS